MSNSDAVSCNFTGGGKVVLTETFAVEDLAWFLDHLFGLRAFLDVNASLGGNSPSSGSPPFPAGDASFIFNHGGSASRY